MSVSVVIAVFNGEATIERAISTVINQTTPPLEVLVVDDASTDGTRGVVRRLAEADRRIKLHACPVNRGPSACRNTGLQAAEGDWVAIQDADDAWEPNRLELLLDAADRYAADLVADNMLLYDAVADEITRTGFPVSRGHRWIRPIDLFEQDVQLGAEFGYGLLQPMLRRAFLQTHGLAYREDLRYGEDMLLLGEILFKGARAVVISDPLYICTTRVGERSKKASPHSKSIPRFDLIVRGLKELQTKHREQVSPEIDKAIDRLADRYSLVHEANLARQIRHERGMAAYAAHLSRRPRLVLQTVRQRRNWLAARLSRVLGLPFSPPGVAPATEAATGPGRP